MARKSYNLSISEDLIKNIQSIAQKEKRSLSHQIELFLEKALSTDLDITTRDIMIASQSSLIKCWDTPEEDEAWKDL
mgnify:CR=1 FL=1